MNNWIYWLVFVSLSMTLFFFVNKLAYGEYGKPNQKAVTFTKIKDPNR